MSLRTHPWPLLAAVLSLLGAGVAQAQIAPPRDALDASYWPRVGHPPAALPGKPGAFLPQAAAGKTSVPAQALDEAAQFVQATNGQALIVVHKGVVQIERYFDGTDARTPFSSHGFARTLAALALGAAVAAAPLADPPGTEFAYDNDILQAMGLVVERATGKSYVDDVGRPLWQPLGASAGEMLLDGGTWNGRRVLSRAFVEALRTPSAANPNFGFQVALGSAWLDPRLVRVDAAQAGSLAPSAAPDLMYLSGAGGLQLALIPSEQLLILRIGKASKAWRDQALPNLIYAALHPEKTADWGWLYDWRLANQAAPGSPVVIDADKPQHWPAERVVGGGGAALPRRAGSCLSDATLAPALAEIRRVGSYSFLVWRDGAVEYEYYAPGFGPDTRAEPASMHKSVMGILYGQALADGSIPSLQTPVSRWLTEWANDPRGAITVEQMLQMASGLAPLPFDLKPGSPYSRALYGADLAAVPLGFPLADAPGSRFNYASGISQLLGLILERATGQRYADYLSTRLWQPLGAADAYVTLDHPGGHPRTSSALFARPEDWVRLGVLFAQHGQFNGRQVVDAAWLDAMARPSPTNPNYGYQLWRGSPHAAHRGYGAASPYTIPARAPFLADDMLFFDGSGAQRVYVSPAEKLVIVRLGAGVFDWDDSMVPSVVTQAARACKAR